MTSLYETVLDEARKWKSKHGTFETYHLTEIAKDWKISEDEAKKLLDKFDEQFGGPVEWKKDIPNKFFQPDAKVEYEFDLDKEEWVKK